MARVYFEPGAAVKYVGAKHKRFDTSLARPKPTLKRGDIVIVDKRAAFNLTRKGFGEFEEVDMIEFVKADTKRGEQLIKLEEELDAYKKHNNELFDKNVELSKELDTTNAALSAAAADEASGDGE